MRTGASYRGARRNEHRMHIGPEGVRTSRRLDREFKRLGAKWQSAFDDALVKYNPPETSGYWPNREDLKHAGKLGVAA